MLCSYGAEVIKIENLSGDDMRSAGNSEGVVCEDDKNPLFSLANSGKKLIAVNLKSPEGKELFERLLAWADVFITNVRAASLERLGIGYDAVAGRFPRLIYAHFGAYGPEGPDAALPGFDSTASGCAAGLSRTGWSGRAPSRPPTPSATWPPAPPSSAAYSWPCWAASAPAGGPSSPPASSPAASGATPWPS